MQDLIDRFQKETVPLLCAKWPEKFRALPFINEGENFLYMKLALGVERRLRPTSIDSLAAIAEACGVVTAATYATVSAPRKWLAMYVDNLGVKTVLDEWFDSELAARLAATIAAIAAVGGEA